MTVLQFPQTNAARKLSSERAVSSDVPVRKKKRRRPSYVAKDARLIEGWFKVSRRILKGRELPSLYERDYASITNKLQDGLHAAIEADGIEVRPCALWPYRPAVLWLINKDEPLGDVELSARCAVLNFIEWVTATSPGGTLSDAKARVECAKKLSDDVGDDGEPLLIEIAKSLYIDMLQLETARLQGQH